VTARRCVADCSDCIRRHGDLQNRSLGVRTCPECRAPWQESHLDVKAVHSLSVAVKSFQSAKLQIVATAAPQQADETPASTCINGHLHLQSRKRSRQSSAQHSEWEDLTNQPGPAQQSQAQPSAAGKVPGNGTGRGTPAKAAAPKVVPSGCGCCPVCHRVFSLRFLPNHVESCLISTDVADLSSKDGDGQKNGGSGVVDLTDPSGAPPLLSLEFNDVLQTSGSRCKEQSSCRSKC
jgi:hypothetical protein